MKAWRINMSMYFQIKNPKMWDSNPPIFNMNKVSHYNILPVDFVPLP